MNRFLILLASLMGLAAVVLGFAVSARSDPGWSNPAALLRYEASRRPGQALSEPWARLGTRALPALCRALEEEESSLGQFVRQKLNAMAERWSRPELYRPPLREVRAAAARVVATLGLEGQVALPSLIRALELGSAREEVALTLLKMGPAASNAVPILLRQIREPYPRQIACRALLRIGASRQTWLEFQADPRPFVKLTSRVGALWADGQSQAALTFLADAAARPETRPWAGRLLRDLGPEAAPVSGRLARGLKSPHGGTRQFTAELLGDLGPNSTVVEPLILALARETEREPRLALISALGQMGPAATNALPALEQFRNGADEEQIRLAREAVGKIQP